MFISPEMGEHGREIFDEEVEAQTAKPSTAKPTKSVSSETVLILCRVCF